MVKWHRVLVLTVSGIFLLFAMPLYELAKTELLAPGKASTVDYFKDSSSYVFGMAALVLSLARIIGPQLRNYCSPLCVQIELPEMKCNYLPPETHVLPVVKSKWTLQRGKSNNRAVEHQADDTHYFHLRVVNKNPGMVLSKVSVLLVKAERLRKTVVNNVVCEKWDPIEIVMPKPFTWAPSELTQIREDIVDERLMDFGFVSNSNKKNDPHETMCFCPTLAWSRDGRREACLVGETVRYYLCISAGSGSASLSEIQVVEVHMSGKWESDVKKMSKNVCIVLKEKIRSKITQGA